MHLLSKKKIIYPTLEHSSWNFWLCHWWILIFQIVWSEWKWNCIGLFFSLESEVYGKQLFYLWGSGKVWLHSTFPPPYFVGLHCVCCCCRKLGIEWWFLISAASVSFLMKSHCFILWRFLWIVHCERGWMKWLGQCKILVDVKWNLALAKYLCLFLIWWFLFLHSAFFFSHLGSLPLC